MGHAVSQQEKHNTAAIVLIILTALFLMVAVGPLLGLFVYAPPHTLLAALAVEEAREALWLTLRGSLLAVGLALVFGLPTAVCLARVNFRGKMLINALVELPIALPPLVMGVALILIWGRKGLLGHYLAEAGYPLSYTWMAVVIAQFVVAAPYFVRIAKAAIEQVPVSLEEASMTLGRSLPATFGLVTLPLAGRGILTAIVTCWARAMSEFGATVIFAGAFPGRTQTAPTAIFTLMQHEIEAAVALAVVMLVFSGLAFVLAQVGVGRLGLVGGVA